jgi:hypothetical protein
VSDGEFAAFVLGLCAWLVLRLLVQVIGTADEE